MTDEQTETKRVEKHTPEPWSLETVTTQVGTCHKIGPFPSLGRSDVVGGSSVTYAIVYADNVQIHDYGHSTIGDELLANARRIVACVNACEGIDDPTELRGQRDELLEALEEIAQARGAYSLDRLTHATNTIESMVSTAQAAIAKAKGVE